MSEHFLYTVTENDLLEVLVEVADPEMNLFGGITVEFACKVVLTDDRGAYELDGEMCFWEPNHLLQTIKVKRLCTIRLADGGETLNGNRIPKRIPITIREAGVLAVGETKEAKDTDA